MDMDVDEVFNFLSEKVLDLIRKTGLSRTRLYFHQANAFTCWAHIILSASISAG